MYKNKDCTWYNVQAMLVLIKSSIDLVICWIDLYVTTNDLMCSVEVNNIILISSNWCKLHMYMYVLIITETFHTCCIRSCIKCIYCTVVVQLPDANWCKDKLFGYWKLLSTYCTHVRVHVHVGLLWYNTARYNIIQCAQYNTMCTIWYNTIQHIVQCNTVQYNTIHYNTIQYNIVLTIQYNVRLHLYARYNTKFYRLHFNLQ